MGINWDYILDVAIYVASVPVICGLVIISLHDKNLKKRHEENDKMLNKATKRLTIQLQTRVVQLTNYLLMRELCNPAPVQTRLKVEGAALLLCLLNPLCLIRVM